MTLDSASQQLEKAPIPSLLLHYALPSVITMVATSLYNIMDSVFIGHGVGPLGISALAIALPLMNLGAAFGSLIGAGAGALMSIKMGEKDKQSQTKILGNTLMLNIILGVSFSVIGLLFLNPILRIFGASENLLPYAKEYMRIILFGNIFTHIYLGLNTLLRASGHPRYSMSIMLTAIGLNGVLDALFILVFHWGVAGAAWATVIAQVLATIFEIGFFSRKSHPIHFTPQSLKIDGRITRNIFSIGMAPFMLNLGTCIVVIFINNALMSYGGDLHIGAYGIVNRIGMVIAMIILGLSQGMQPITGYNFGARNIDRVKKAFKISVVVATIVTSLGAMACICFPHAITLLFTTDKQLTDISVYALRVSFLAFPIVGFQMIVANFFQSIGMAIRAVIQSVLRQMVLLIPGVLILPLFFGSNGVWMAIPISDTLSSIIALLVLRSGWKYLNRLQKEKEASKVQDGIGQTVEFN